MLPTESNYIVLERDISVTATPPPESPRSRPAAASQPPRSRAGVAPIPCRCLLRNSLNDSERQWAEIGNEMFCASCCLRNAELAVMRGRGRPIGSYLLLLWIQLQFVVDLWVASYVPIPAANIIYLLLARYDVRPVLRHCMSATPQWLWCTACAPHIMFVYNVPYIMFYEALCKRGQRCASRASAAVSNVL